MIICVDASVLVPAIVEPRDDIEATVIKRWLCTGDKLIAPFLIRYELANAFHQYLRAGLRSAQELSAYVDTVRSLPIELVLDDQLHIAAIEMARRLDIGSVYDAHYLALAERRGAEFWTGDAKLVRAVGDRLPFVRLLSAGQTG